MSKHCSSVLAHGNYHHQKAFAVNILKINHNFSL